jgi:hypothetical protein
MKTKGISLTKIPDIPESKLTPTDLELLAIIHERDEVIAYLLDEIARSKNHNPRPKIKPSRLEKDKKQCSTITAPSNKSTRKKTKDLPIVEKKFIQPDHIPTGSTFKDYRPYTVQNIEIRLVNTRYFLARWKTPDGKIIIGQLPKHVKGHFGEPLACYILYQYYHNHVTQPLLLKELTEFGIKISAAQLSRMLIQNKDRFHQEKADILASALAVSNYINVDDTGARHQGKNGYTTHIGNEAFAWFESTSSKSRINFLELLRTNHTDYVLNNDALTYMQQAKLSAKTLSSLIADKDRHFENKRAWQDFLDQKQITTPRHRQIATEGALLASLTEHDIDPNLIIISDDAGQFNILLHGLCWVHAERTISKIVPFGKQQKQTIETILDNIWQYYQELKDYKKDPDPNKKTELLARFDLILAANTGYRALNQALLRLQRNKKELLLVLEKPNIPLHNNTSERHLRDMVKKRKISGGTRSDQGRKARDTFLSLKITCQKLNVSFWEYLSNRLKQTTDIPPINELVIQKINST